MGMDATALNVYVGYDPRIETAVNVCVSSLQRRSTVPVHLLQKSSLFPAFNRPTEPNQSTEFTYTRFMVPFLNNYTGWSVFCDCDFIFVEDIASILKYADPTKAVSVCKHPSYNPRTAIKMDGIKQHVAYRKNWASLMLFNNAHPSNKKLTPELINTIMPGVLLHQFSWLDDTEIGSLPLEWNCLDDYYHLEQPKAIHYTDGGPWFKGYEQTFYSDRWYEEYYYWKAQQDIITE